MKKLALHIIFIILSQFLATVTGAQVSIPPEDLDDEIEHNEGAGAIKYWQSLEKMIEEQNRKNGVGNINRNEARYNAFKQEQSKLQKGQSISGSWTQVTQSQSNVGMGRIEDVAFSPVDVNTFYVATSGGGVWKTTNGGTSYFPLTDGLPTGGVSSIVVDPNNANTLYIFAGGGLGSNYYPGIIYKTTDGGFTWVETGFKKIADGIVGYELKIHPTNSNILFIATNYGLYKSVNAGITWFRVLVPPAQSDISVLDIEFKPGDPSVVYASSIYKIHVSESNGDTATWVSQNVPAPPTTLINYTATRIAVSASSPNDIAIAVSVNSSNATAAADGAVFYVKGNYNTVTNAINFGTVRKIKACNSVCYRSGVGRIYGDIYVSQTNMSNILVAGLETFASFSGGSGWIIKSYDCVTNSPRNFHVDVGRLRSNNGSFYVTMDGGIYTQPEDYISSSAPWTNISAGIEITQSYSHDASPQDAERYMYANQDNGVHVRTSSSSYYNYIGGDGTMCKINKSDKELYYGSIQNGEYMTRHDGGGDTYITPRFTANSDPADTAAYTGSFVFANAFALNENNNNYIYAVKRSLYISPNRGNTWTRKPITGATSTHYILKVGKTSSNYMYVIQDGDGMFQSTQDGGNSWTDITANKRFNGTISNLAINPNNSLEIYITYYGNTDTSKVYRSTNGGISWTNLSYGLPNIDVRCIVVVGNAENSLYVGNDLGVYYRDDNLGKWINFSNNLPVVFVMNLVYDATNSKISAGTYGRGIWVSDIYNASSCVVDRTLNSTYYYRNVYTASNDITSAGTVYGDANTNIKFSAGKNVILQPGFVAQVNSNFVASAEGCNPSPTLLKANPVKGKKTIKTISNIKPSISKPKKENPEKEK